MPDPSAQPSAGIAFNTPFAAQVEFLRAKLRLPSQRWDDIERSAHDRAFIVAGAAKADLVTDLHEAVTRAAESGAGLEAFRRDFKAIVAKHGWSGWTGEGTKAGEAWRTRVIYQTNMTTSYAAGRWRQLTDPDYVRLRPFWRYVHSDSVLNPRPQHLAWNGLTLRHDHPFWRTHYPPNGWGCQCRVVPVGAREGAAAGQNQPPEGWDAPDPKTGAPRGIDRGFDYAPGARADVALRTIVQNKLITYPPAIGRALAADLNRYINATQSPADFVAQVLQDRQRTDPLWLGFVESADALSQAASRDTTGFLITLPADVPRHVLASHGHDGKGQRPATPADFEVIASILNEADQIRAGDASRHGNETVIATKQIGTEIYRAVFEVLPGKKNRALALFSLVIKTQK